MKSDDDRTVEVELFDSKVLRLAVGNRDAAAVRTWRLCCHYPKSASFPSVNSVGEFGLL